VWVNKYTTTSTTNCTTWHSWTLAPAPKVQTAEEIRQREAQVRRDAALKAKAERQADLLLRELLTPEQRAAYESERRFHVITESGRRYEVDCRQRMHNIFDVDANGRRVMEHCIYQVGNLPLPDNTAAQLLLLRANEEEFRRIANQRRVA
jgi:hypothetical protein